MRTLVFAYKEIKGQSADSISSWKNSDFENDLILLGATGVEDKLQDKVKECITDFKEAGIKPWIITGDKDSTAKAVGFSSGIFNEDRNVQQFDKLELDDE